jgi:hypothetical protein
MNSFEKNPLNDPVYLYCIFSFVNFWYSKATNLHFSSAKLHSLEMVITTTNTQKQKQK